MRQRGSILIVVLGLLAILAIVGVAFVTMSSIDRSTAANFALQSQFDLAADGAVDYVSHYLVQDLWEWHVFTSTYKGGLILTTNTDPKADTPGAHKASNWDYPGSSSSDTSADPWLCSTIEDNSTPKHMSFEVATAVQLFGMDFGTRTPSTSGDKLPDNLHFPGTTPPTNGIWVPDLAFPYESGIIRVSVTVLDHAALINLNAHGKPGTTSVGDWTFGKACGLGYFICDVALPDLQSTFADEVLVGKDAQHPGRWGTGGPGNKQTGEVLIENPYAGTDAPFTLDEEFELRRLSGTFYKSRLETAGGAALDYNPLQASTGGATDNQCRNRLKFTTVGWTAEIRGDPINKDQGATPITDPTHALTGSLWSANKLDLNDPAKTTDSDIRTALYDGRVFLKGTGTTAPYLSPTMAQFAINIKAFREQQSGWLSWKDTANNVYVGARRQPILLRVNARRVSGGEKDKAATWGVKAQVYNPWLGNYPGAATLNTTSMRVRFYKADSTTMDGQTAFPTSMAANAFYDSGEKTFTTPAKAEEQNDVSQVLGPYFARLELTGIPGKTITTLDWCDTAKMTGLATFARRPITVEDEIRGTTGADQAKIQVLYVNDWQVGAEIWTTTQPSNDASNKDHPIRFPHSVAPGYVGGTTGPLPIAATSTTSFKAFPRLGDLNQVLCPKTDSVAGDNFWPWLDRVAKSTSGSDEEDFKFNWKDTAVNPESNISRTNAANVFCVNSPWYDNIDNDGDGAKDITGTTPDTGKELITSTTKAPENTGRFAGPEIRIAGKINLNTASDATLEALDPTGALGVKAAVKSARASGPIKSIAQIVEKLTSSSGDDAKGWIEKRDLAFTRISNVASVRSDTFSIYGTVQYVIPPRGGAQMRVIKSRRFWALVDRSPSAAYSPASSDFIHPRVLNFQWLD